MCCMSLLAIICKDDILHTSLTYTLYNANIIPALNLWLNIFFHNSRFTVTGESPGKEVTVSLLAKVRLSAF